MFDRFDSGWTILPMLERLGEGVGLGSPALQGAIEAAVLDLLEQRTDSDALERTGIA